MTRYGFWCGFARGTGQGCLFGGFFMMLFPFVHPSSEGVFVDGVLILLGIACVLTGNEVTNMYPAMKSKE